MLSLWVVLAKEGRFCDGKGSRIVCSPLTSVLLQADSLTVPQFPTQAQANWREMENSL